MYCAFGAQFLAAVASDTAVVFVRRRFLFIAVVPFHSLGINRAHLNTNAAFDAFALDNLRLRNNDVLGKPQRAARLERLERFAADIEFFIDKTLDGVSEILDFGCAADAQPSVCAEFQDRDKGRIEVDYPAYRGVKCNRVG